MKVTLVPAQTVVADADTDTLAGKFGFTVMVLVELTAGQAPAPSGSFVVKLKTTEPL